LGSDEADRHFSYSVTELEANSVISVNVLEHVERDTDFLRAADTALVPGGAFLKAGWSGLNYHE